MKLSGGVNEMVRQAARLQRKVEQARKQCEDREVSAGALGDKVKATVTLGGKIRRIDVDPDFLKEEGIDVALDGACLALNGALELAEKELGVEIDKVTGGVKIPGM